MTTVSKQKRAFSLVSFSAGASANPSMGHFHWMYAFIYEKRKPQTSSLGLTIGSLQEEAVFIRPTLGNISKATLNLSPKIFLAYRVWLLPSLFRGLEKRGMSHLQFYDGGLLDLLVATWTAKNVRAVTVLYNFHWATEWLELFEDTRPVAMALKEQLCRLVVTRPKNLMLSAETSKLAREMSGHLNTQLDTYPIFAAFDSPKQPRWKERSVDLLLSPQRLDEFRFSFEIWKRSRAKGWNVKILISLQLRAEVDNQGGLGQIPNEDFFFGPLSRGEYIHLLTETKVVLLPYTKPYFKWGSSGKFSEAILAGAFPFVPDGVAASHQSNISPSEHALPANVKKALGIIETRLARGRPPDLNAPTYETFVSWLEGFQPNLASASAKKKVNPFFLLVVAFLYRPQRDVLASLRRSFGNQVDKIRGSIGKKRAQNLSVRESGAEHSEDKTRRHLWI